MNPNQFLGQRQGFQNGNNQQNGDSSSGISPRMMYFRQMYLIRGMRNNGQFGGSGMDSPYQNGMQGGGGGMNGMYGGMNGMYGGMNGMLGGQGFRNPYLGFQNFPQNNRTNENSQDYD